MRPALKNSGTAVPKKLGPDAEKSASGPSLICALRQFCAAPQRHNYSIERIVQLVRWLSPGSITRRLVPELNASGGQVMGSTASPRRSLSGSGKSAVWTWTHGAVDGQLISTPVPRGSRTRTVAVPLLSRLTVVSAWSILVAPLGRASRTSNSVPSAGTRPLGSSRSGVTSKYSAAGTSSDHSSSGLSPASKYGWGP